LLPQQKVCFKMEIQNLNFAKIASEETMMDGLTASLLADVISKTPTGIQGEDVDIKIVTKSSVLQFTIAEKDRASKVKEGIDKVGFEGPIRKELENIKGMKAMMKDIKSITAKPLDESFVASYMPSSTEDVAVGNSKLASSVMKWTSAKGAEALAGALEIGNKLWAKVNTIARVAPAEAGNEAKAASCSFILTLDGLSYKTLSQDDAILSAVEDALNETIEKVLGAGEEGFKLESTAPLTSTDMEAQFIVRAGPKCCATPVTKPKTQAVHDKIEATYGVEMFKSLKTDKKVVLTGPTDVPLGGPALFSLHWFIMLPWLDFLKAAVLVVFALLLVAHGNTMTQVAIAIGISLVLWACSRYCFSQIVEGTLFKSSFLELAQSALITIPLISQTTGLMDNFTTSVLMIMVVVWIMMTILFKMVNAKMKEYEEILVTYITSISVMMLGWLDTFSSWENFVAAVKAGWEKFKKRAIIMWHDFQMIWRIQSHKLITNMGNPAWRRQAALGLVFLILLFGIIVGQIMALKHLGTQEFNVSAYLLTYLLTLVAIGLVYAIVFMVVGPKLAENSRKLFEAQAHALTEDIWRGSMSAIVASDKGGEKKNLEAVQKATEYQLADIMQELSAKSYGNEKVKKASYTPLLGEGSSPALTDYLGGLVDVGHVYVFSDDGAGLTPSVLRTRSGAPKKLLLCTEQAYNAPRYLVERTPVQLRWEDIVDVSSIKGAKGSNGLPKAGLKGDLSVLVASLQVVTFIGTTAGQTDRNDGVLSLWREPILEPAEQLVKWWEVIFRFFKDYGADFTRDSSKAFPIMESLFWGRKTASDKPGSHLASHIVSQGGTADADWIQANMSDLVKRLAGEIQKTRDNKKPKEPEPVVAPVEREPSMEDCTGIGIKGKMTLIIKGAKDLPNVDGPCVSGLSDPYFECTVKTDGTVQGGKKQTGEVIWNNLNPVWNHTIVVDDFEPGKDSFDIVIRDKNVYTADTAMGKVHLRTELTGGWPKGGGVCFDGQMQIEGQILGTFMCRARPPRGFVQLQASFVPPRQAKAPPPPPPPKPEPPSITRYFCGGSLTWQCLYPPTTPQLLHVAVAAEDLRSTEGDQWAAPPLREQRAVGINAPASASTSAGSSSEKNSPERTEPLV